MKKIYLRESQIGKELLLPQFLYQAVKFHKTSLGDNPAFPGEDDHAFDYTVLKDRFKDLCAQMSDIGVPLGNTEDLLSYLSKLVVKCKELEKPIKDSLEKLCENAVNRLFAIPDGEINFMCKLVDKVKYEIDIAVTPESSGAKKYKFKDIADFDFSKKAIAKRRLINSLIMGAAEYYSSMKSLYIEDLNKLNPELSDLYDKIMIINSYLNFITKEEMTDDKPKQGSFVEVHVGFNGKKSTINAQGIIFPLMLHDAIKGFFELFSVYGLPTDPEKAKHIVSKADFLLAEPWDMRFGVQLWKMIFDKMELADNTNIIPYIFTYIALLPFDEFNSTMKELFMGTEKGDEILSGFIERSKRNDAYRKFKNRVNARNMDRAVIADSYFTASELDGYNIDGDDDDVPVISELTEGIILESQESKSIAAAKKLVMQRLNYNERQADEFVRIKLRSDIPSLKDVAAKFVFGVTRMFCDGELYNADIITKLDNTLKLVGSEAHINDYDRDLNGLSAEELIETFAEEITQNLNIEKDIDAKFEPTGECEYEIVPIKSHEQATEYGDYTDWCITHDEGMYDSYTSEGMNQVYFCLKPGYEYIDRKKGKTYPSDEYGLSMISIIVNPEGALRYCTCRWNHGDQNDRACDDNFMDYDKIRNLMQVRFFDTFKPNRLWEDILNDAFDKLANGASLEDVFDSVSEFSEGYAVISLKKRCNYINENGKLLLNEWVDRATGFQDGIAKVDVGMKSNLINRNGEFIFDTMFDHILRICDTGELDYWYLDEKPKGNKTIGYCVFETKDKSFYIIGNDFNTRLTEEELFETYNGKLPGVETISVGNVMVARVFNKFKLINSPTDDWYDGIKKFGNSQKYVVVTISYSEHDLMDIDTGKLCFKRLYGKYLKKEPEEVSPGVFIIEIKIDNKTSKKNVLREVGNGIDFLLGKNLSGWATRMFPMESYAGYNNDRIYHIKRTDNIYQITVDNKENVINLNTCNMIVNAPVDEWPNNIDYKCSDYSEPVWSLRYGESSWYSSSNDLRYTLLARNGSVILDKVNYCSSFRNFFKDTIGVSIDDRLVIFDLPSRKFIPDSDFKSFDYTTAYTHYNILKFERIIEPDGKTSVMYYDRNSKTVVDKSGLYEIMKNNANLDYKDDDDKKSDDIRVLVPGKLYDIGIGYRYGGPTRKLLEIGENGERHYVFDELFENFYGVEGECLIAKRRSSDVNIYNWVKKKFVFDEPIDDVEVRDGFYKVSIRVGKSGNAYDRNSYSVYNYVDSKGNILLNGWLKKVSNDIIDGYSIIMKDNGKYSLFDLNTRTLNKAEYDMYDTKGALNSNSRYFIVGVKDPSSKYNEFLCNVLKQGRPLFKDWWRSIIELGYTSDYVSLYSMGEGDYTSNIGNINTGEYISDTTIENLGWHSDLRKITKNGKIYLISTDYGIHYKSDGKGFDTLGELDDNNFAPYTRGSESGFVDSYGNLYTKEEMESELEDRRIRAERRKNNPRRDYDDDW